MKKEDTYNDRAGIIFLLLLIGTVFIADFFIEISKTAGYENSQNKNRCQYIMPGYSPEPSLSFLSCEDFLINKLQKNIYSSVQINTNLELSIIFFLFISFVFSAKNFNFDPNKLIISFLYFISFIFKEFSNTAFPRPPPQT